MPAFNIGDHLLGTGVQELQRLRLWQLTGTPSSPTEGLFWFNSNTGDKRLYFYDAAAAAGIAVPRLDRDEIWTGVPAFNRSGSNPPFTCNQTLPSAGSTATQVTNLNAQYVGGYAPSTTATINTLPVYGTGGVLLVATPTASGHAATKAYVDAMGQGLNPAALGPVKAASTGTIANLASCPVSQDGVTLIAGDRFLVKDTASPDGIAAASHVYDGIYVVGTVSGGSAPLTRSTDADSTTEMDRLYTFVEDGTVNQGSSWLQLTNDPVIGTDALNFQKFYQAVAQNPGNGIDITGNVVSVKVSGSTTYVANRILFHSSTSTLDGSANLTWNGSTLTVTGAVTVTGTTTLATSLTGMLKGTSGVVSAVTNTTNHVAFWSDGNTIGGTAAFTWNGSVLALDGDITLTGAQTVGTSTGILTLNSPDADIYLQGGASGTKWSPRVIGRKTISGMTEITDFTFSHTDAVTTHLTSINTFADSTGGSRNTRLDIEVRSAGSSKSVQVDGSTLVFSPGANRGFHLGSSSFKWETLSVFGAITNDALTAGRVLIAGASGVITDDADMTFSTDTLTVTKIVGSTSITASNLTAGRVLFAGTAGVLSDDADMTFATDTLTVTKIVASTSLTASNLTSGRVTFAGASGVLTDDSDLTFSADTLTATKLLAPTSVSTPSLISTAGITVTPASGSSVSFALATTGDFIVNTNQFFVDTSAARVGFFTAAPSTDVSIGGDADRTMAVERHLTANTHGSHFTIKGGGATLGATDKNGGAIVCFGGIATGSGHSSLQWGVAEAGSNGTTDRTPAVWMVLTGLSGTTRLGLGIDEPDARLHLAYFNIGATQSDAYGFMLKNAQAAAAGAQQYSPPIVWVGQGWKTDSIAASQPTSFRSFVVPVQGLANPSAIWKLESSINGGSYTERLSVTSGGVLTAASFHFSSDGSVTNLTAANNIINTTAYIKQERTVGSLFYQLFKTGDTQPRFGYDAGDASRFGMLSWGPGGSTAVDTQLYRTTLSGELQLDSHLIISGLTASMLVQTSSTKRLVSSNSLPSGTTLDGRTIGRVSTGTFGDGSATSFTIAHSLGSANLIVRFRKVSTGEEWQFGNTTDATNITVGPLSFTPSSGEFRWLATRCD